MSIRAYDDVDDVERKRIEDYLVAVSKLAVSTIPIAGPALSEILGFFLGSPVEARRIEFLRDLDEKITGLIESGVVTIDSLKQNEDFMNVVINAIPMALKAFEDEKRTAFRNAILNTAMKLQPNVTKAQLFLQRLDLMTVAHVKLLHLFADQAEINQFNNMYRDDRSMQKFGKFLYSKHPELCGFEYHYLMSNILVDLKQYGLQKLDSDQVFTQDLLGITQAITELGKEFINFITFNGIK